MSKSERYWINAAIYILLSSMFANGAESLINGIAVAVCFLLAAGYFVAMVVSWFRGDEE